MSHQTDRIDRDRVLPPIKWLKCACCGIETRGRQWPNRDTGWGLCRVCSQPDIKRTPEEEELQARNYGERGVHYDLPSKP